MTKIILWKMHYLIYIYSSFILYSLHVTAESDRCNIEEVSECKSKIIDYEGPNFPYYGENEEQLDKTCKDMNSSFVCIDDYINKCTGDPSCDKKCRGIIQVIQGLTLGSLYESLCLPEDSIQSLYLENYKCFQAVKEKFTNCSEVSQTSQYFVAENKQSDKFNDMKCCFFTWYKQCFINATINDAPEECGENSTFVISFALHQLLKTEEEMCKGKPVCSSPPLPSDKNEIKPPDVPISEPSKNDNKKKKDDSSKSPELFSLNWRILIVLTMLKYFITFKET